MEWLVAAVFVVVSVLLWGVSVRINRNIERQVPINGRFLEVGGERIHYTDEGRGPALLMIHGLSGCGRNLTHSLAPALRERFRVITLDRPAPAIPPGPGGRRQICRPRPPWWPNSFARWICGSRWYWGIPWAARWRCRWHWIIRSRCPG